MLRSIPSNEDFRSSIKIKHVQDKLQDCRRLIDKAVVEIQEKFPKSIFDSADVHLDENATDMNENTADGDEALSSQFNATAEDTSSIYPGQGYSIPELTPPTSPVPLQKEDSNSNDTSEYSSMAPPVSPGQASSSRTTIKHGMMKLFKISTGASSKRDSLVLAPATREGTDAIPLVTSIPRDPSHSILLLFRLELPSSLGVVSRVAVNGDGCIAGCTVHGELFVYYKIPYSRNPDSITRGHDGGVVSLTWLTGPLKSFFITNGTDSKTLLWQITADGIDGPHCETRHESVPTCCCVHPVNKDIVIIGSLDNTVSMYKIEKTPEYVRMKSLGIGSTFTKPITCVSVSPDGKRLAVGSSVGTIGLYDLNTMSLDVEVDCRNRQGSTSNGRKVVGLSWSADSTCVAVSSCDSRVRVVLVSDLSRRTKFKSSYLVSDHMFLGAVFGPPDDERIVTVSESGYLCSWTLHSQSETNEKCLHCDLLGGRLVRLGKDAKETSSGTVQITAATVVPATDPFCTAIQAKMFALGEGFHNGAGIAIVACDTKGNIRIFAELFSPC